MMPDNIFWSCSYGRFRKNVEKTGSTPGTEKLMKTTGSSALPTQKAEPSLIDFGSESTSGAGFNAPSEKLSTKMASVSVNDKSSAGAVPKVSPSKQEDSDFDMFAQSRTATYEKSKTRWDIYQSLVVSWDLKTVENFNVHCLEYLNSGSTYADNSNLDQATGLGAAALSKDLEVR